MVPSNERLSECSDWPHMNFRNCSNNFNIQRDIEYFPVRGHIQGSWSRHFKKGIPNKSFKFVILEFLYKELQDSINFNPVAWVV